MKVLLPLLIIQLFGIAINLPAKELPLYGEVEINEGEYIFLKSDLFKIGKKIELIIYFSFEKLHYYNPNIYVDYCFSDQNEDYTCLTELDSYNDFNFVEDKPKNITIKYNNIFLTMDDKKYNYLLLRVRVDEDYKPPLSLKIVHDPDSGINAKHLYGYYQDINIDEKECFIYDNYFDLENKGDELPIEVTFNSKDKYDSLTIYYDNQNQINEEFTEKLNKYIITDSMKKENDQYTFYFYLPIYNFTKNYIEYQYLVFRPQSVGKNVPIKGMWSNRVGKKVPTYGTLVVENIKDGLFYLNIENLEKGDTIYLQFIVNSPDYLEINYLFSDENYNEMFDKCDHRENVDDKKENDGTTTFYASIDIEKKTKYFLFQLSIDNNLGPKIIIKHTEKNEYTNTTLIVIIVLLIVIIIIVAVIVVLFILRRRKNKVSSSDIENVSPISA